MILKAHMFSSNARTFVIFYVLLQFDNGTQPACFTRNIELKINSRDSKPSLPWSFKNFFSGKKFGPDE